MYFFDSTNFKIPYGCANCGKLNDFLAIRDVVIEETIEDEIKSDAKKYVEDELKKILKNSGFKIS